MSKKRKLPENYLDSIFIPSPDLNWNKEANNIVILDMENKGFYHKIAQKFFRKPKISHISLDKYGSKVWISLDGNNTIYDIVTILKESFPDESDRMLDRVVTFIGILQSNHFVIKKQ